MWIDQYLEYLGDVNLTLDKIRQSVELKDRNLPERLYKYREVNNYSLSNFRDDTVWICSADKYNDPYECATTWENKEVINATLDLPDLIATAELTQHLSPEQLRGLEESNDPLSDIARYLISKEPGRSDSEIQQMLEICSSIRDKYAHEMIQKMTRHIQMCTKVCSFSTRLDSVVMWGHYANCHTGFVMEYTVSDLGPGDIRRNFLTPVVYHQDIYDVTKHHVKAAANKRDFNNLIGVIAAMRKAPDWAYENEWRFIINAGSSFEDRNYRMPKPSALYLGSRIKPEDKASLIDLAATKGVPVYQMELSALEFKLIPKAVK